MTSPCAVHRVFHFRVFTPRSSLKFHLSHFTPTATKIKRFAVCLPLPMSVVSTAISELTPKLRVVDAFMPDLALIISPRQLMHSFADGLRNLRDECHVPSPSPVKLYSVCAVQASTKLLRKMRRGTRSPSTWQPVIAHHLPHAQAHGRKDDLYLKPCHGVQCMKTKRNVSRSHPTSSCSAR